MRYFRYRNEGTSVGFRGSPLDTKYEDRPLFGLQLVEDTVGTDPAPPDVPFAFHLLDISEVRVYRQLPDGVKNSLGVTPRHSLECPTNAGINAKNPSP